MSKAKFGSWAEVFAWAQSEGGLEKWLEVDGNILELPLGPQAKGWMVEISGGSTPGFAISSAFYRVDSRPPYGAPQIVGFLRDLGDHQASGVVFFSFDGEGKLALTRRRLTEKDALGVGQMVVAVTNAAAPDRVFEPVAVIARTEDRGRIAMLSAEQRISIYDSVRDGVEMCAIRELFRWADKPMDELSA